MQFASFYVTTALLSSIISDCTLWAKKLVGLPMGRRSSFGRDKIFLLSASSRPVLGPTQPPVQWVPGSLTSGLKRLRRGTDHSPPTIAEVKNV
jgi:hypothetical protein